VVTPLDDPADRRLTFGVHTAISIFPVLVTEDMVGHKLANSRRTRHVLRTLADRKAKRTA